MVQIDLSGKVAIVTGGGQGLGESITENLHRAGATVVINYLDDANEVNRERAERVRQRLDERAMTYAADVRNSKAVSAMVNGVLSQFGRIDIVVNNAGILRDRTLTKMSPEEWTSVVETNLNGVFHVCRSAAAHLSHDGRIVNVSSIAAFLGFFGQANYAAAKAGVVGLTRVLSRELAKRRITVNAVAPGLVLTEMAHAIPESARADMIKAIPLGRPGEPREVSDVVLFLCSGLASYVTGQVIHVNGGWL